MVQANDSGCNGRTMETTDQRRPRGFIAFGAFFVFGATMAAYAAITLLYPGTMLDSLWALNKRGHGALTSIGARAGGLFIFLSLALACAAAGWFRRRLWGWGLGVTVIAINAMSDLGQLASGERWRGAVGFVFAGALLFYMTRSSVRNYFRRS